MNTQKQKRELEKLLSRYMSDATWYRLRNHLVKLGCSTDEEFLTAFQLLAAMNKGRISPKSKIASIPYGFTDIWVEIQSLSNSQKAEKLMSCQKFITFVTTGQKIKPKDRITNGKRIGINTIWYRWFSSCGLVFEKDKEYTLKSLIPVVALYYSWKAKQKLRLEPSILEVES